MNAVVNRQQESLRGRWLLVSISLAVGAVLLTSGAGVWWGSLTNTGDHITDFLGFRTGGQMFWQDRTHLYDLERQLAVETSTLAPHPLPRVLPYNYPPFFTLLLVPLAWLPFPLA